MDISEKVRKLIEAKVNDLGVIVDSIEYVKEGNNYFLKIVIDKEDYVDVDTCVEVTKLINPLLDEADIIKDSYILDISSKERGENNE